MSGIMSSASSSTTKAQRPEYTVKVAESKDEIEACLDLRVEGEISQSVPDCLDMDMDMVSRTAIARTMKLTSSQSLSLSR